MNRLLACAVTVLLLTGCAEPPVTVGSKYAVQDRIVAAMMARLIEEAGMPVTLRAGLGGSPEAFEALRAGTIDLYPEYSGTALSLLGVPPIDDPEQARARLQDIFGALGFRFLEPLGYRSSYTVVTRRGVARTRDLRYVSDLSDAAPALRLGVSESFAARVRDGLTALQDRFALRFKAIEVVPEPARETLYGLLVDERLDVIIGFSTDPQIQDFGLSELPFRQPFFPDYEAMPLVSEAALERHPGLVEALAPLVNRLEETRLRRMVREVQVGGRSPTAVAEAALAELGLIEATLTAPDIPLRIAVDETEIGGPTANNALRAVREAMPGRAVALAGTVDAIGAVTAGQARLAVVPAAAHFHFIDGHAARDERVEAIAVVGTSLLHVIAAETGPGRLGAAQRLATGPVGSPSHLLGRVIARHGDREVALLPLSAGGAAAAGAAVASGEADAALVLASRGRPDIEDLLTSSPALTLVNATAWWDEASRLALPFLQTARLRANDYAGLDADVELLAMQTVLTGPIRESKPALGEQQGPSAYSGSVSPLTDGAVRRINVALGPHPDVGANLRRADAIAPRVEPAPSARNPAPTQAVLTIGLFAFLALAIRLLVRPLPGSSDSGP